MTAWKNDTDASAYQNRTEDFLLLLWGTLHPDDTAGEFYTRDALLSGFRDVVNAVRNQGSLNTEPLDQVLAYVQKATHGIQAEGIDDLGKVEKDSEQQLVLMASRARLDVAQQAGLMMVNQLCEMK